LWKTSFQTRLGFPETPNFAIPISAFRTKLAPRSQCCLLNQVPRPDLPSRVPRLHPLNILPLNLLGRLIATSFSGSIHIPTTSTASDLADPHNKRIDGIQQIRDAGTGTHISAVWAAAEVVVVIRGEAVDRFC